ncbi:hypothetical protein MNBD_ALPHA04-2229, partial [hydrothermal vent metagenome]
MDRNKRQLNAIRKWLEAAAPDIGADLSIRLWNGDVVPLGPNAKDDIVIAVNSPEVVRRLIFAPKLMTIFELYSESLLDIDGGTPLEAARRWDHMRVLTYARSMSKTGLMKTLWPFVFKSKGATASNELSYEKKVADKIADGRNDMD